MEQIQLNTLKESVKKGRIANTYLLVGKANSDVLGAGFELVKDIIKSPFAGMEIHQQQEALAKLKTLTNPDIHYFYPVNTTAEIKTKASSKDFIDKWRELVSENTKINLVDWYNKIGLGNKQATINKDEAEEIFAAQEEEKAKTEGALCLKAYWAKTKSFHPIPEFENAKRKGKVKKTQRER